MPNRPFRSDSDKPALVPGRRSQLAKHFGQLVSAAAGNESFLNIREVAELLRVSDRTVRRWVTGKKLVAHQFGGATRISAIELSGFITRAHRGPAAQLQPRNPLADQFYTAEDVAEILNVSKRTVCRYIKFKMLIVHKFGRPTRIADRDLRDFVDRSVRE